LNAEKNDYQNPEPVPHASQLAVLPFLAGVDGLLARAIRDKRRRLTIHRRMMREQKEYLQQVCAYLGSDDHDWSRDKAWHEKVGRIFHLDTGIVGAAFRKRQIYRTRRYKNDRDLMKDLADDMAKIGDSRDPGKVALSYLAIPFLGPKKEVVLILYGECWKRNVFANDELVEQIQAMCAGFCRLFDGLQKAPFSNLRNFPLQMGQPSKGGRTVYPRLQETVKGVSPPRFRNLISFNYEASVT
jgi:hypothetical protein